MSARDIAGDTIAALIDDALDGGHAVVLGATETDFDAELDVEGLGAYVAGQFTHVSEFSLLGTRYVCAFLPSKVAAPNDSTPEAGSDGVREVRSPGFPPVGDNAPSGGEPGYERGRDAAGVGPAPTLDDRREEIFEALLEWALPPAPSLRRSVFLPYKRRAGVEHLRDLPTDDLELVLEGVLRSGLPERDES